MTDDANQPPADGDEHPNHYLREWREFMGWSQEELGAMVNAHQTKIGRIETGKRELKTGFLRDLARVFGVPSSALLDVNPATEAGAQTASMLVAWNKLTEAQRGDVLKMVRALGQPNDKSSAS